MNKIILMGRLTKDPEVRYGGTSSEDIKAVARFSLAVDRKFSKEGDPTADFFNCTTFGKIAEFVEKYLKKGTKVLVTGRVQNDNYTNKDGQTVYSVQIIVEEIEFAEAKNSGSANTGTGSGQGNRSEGNTGSGNSSGAPAEGFMNIPNGIDEELPFN